MNKMKIQNKVKRKVKKEYPAIVIVGLILISVGLSTIAVQVLINKPQSEEQTAIAAKSKNKEDTSKSKELPVQDDRHASVMSSLMDSTVSSCYYDLYIQNVSASLTLSSGDICNNAVMFFQEYCKSVNLESCHSDYFKKFVKGMEG